MLEKVFISGNTIVLEGAWCVEQAVGLQKLLAARLAQLADVAPGPDRVELELSELCEVDACGCQLLVLFMENLKRRGISPVPCGLAQQTMDKIALLGFSEAFTLQG